MLALALAVVTSPALAPSVQSGMNCSGCILSHSAPQGNTQTFQLNHCPVNVTFEISNYSNGTCVSSTCATPVKCEYKLKGTIQASTCATYSGYKHVQKTYSIDCSGNTEPGTVGWEVSDVIDLNSGAEKVHRFGTTIAPCGESKEYRITVWGECDCEGGGVGPNGLLGETLPFKVTCSKCCDPNA